MPRVLFTAAARADLAEALDWFAAHAPHTIPHFREAMRAVVARIGENPKQFPVASRRTRRALLRHFPYLIIFREANDAAYVIAVFHTSRNPAA
ncbi:MAG TPA: type II toxin-antitoxin system RelE/ParE family toxin, partial [Roseiarcus sp.]|nr:type II toxin-antitoxin system RelE/ParE family toxin [Roseiarcus sp.]